MIGWRFRDGSDLLQGRPERGEGLIPLRENKRGKEGASRREGGNARGGLDALKQGERETSQPQSPEIIEKICFGKMGRRRVGPSDLGARRRSRRSRERVT